MPARYSKRRFALRRLLTGSPGLAGRVRQDKRLADLAERDPVWLRNERRFEALNRLVEWLKAQSESLMMHRHDVVNAGGVTHRDHLFRSGVGANPWLVSADGHDREIVGPAIEQAGEAVGHGRVSTENNASAVAFQKVAIVAAVGVSPHPRTPMIHRNRFHHDGTVRGNDAPFFAPTQFRDIAKASPAQQITGAWRGDDGSAFGKLAERVEIEVVEVRVRKKNKIDRRQVAEGQRGARQAFRADREKEETNAGARKQDGIGQDRDAEEIDEHRGMAEPGGGQLRIIPLVRPGTRRSRRDRSPAFRCPLAPKVGEPASGWRSWTLCSQEANVATLVPAAG